MVWRLMRHGLERPSDGIALPKERWLDSTTEAPRAGSRSIFERFLRRRTHGSGPQDEYIRRLVRVSGDQVRGARGEGDVAASAKSTVSYCRNCPPRRRS